MLRWIQMWRASQSQVLYKMARWCGAVMHRESPFFLLTSPWVTSWLTTWRPGAGCVFFLRSWWQEAWITHLASSGFVTFWTQFWRFQGFRAFCGYSLPGTAVTFNIPKVFTPLEPQQSAVNSPHLSCESQWANSSDWVFLPTSLMGQQDPKGYWNGPDTRRTGAPMVEPTIQLSYTHYFIIYHCQSASFNSHAANFLKVR